MTTVRDIYNEIDRIAPFSLQESYDNSGLIIGNGANEVKRAEIALDVTEDIALDAVKSGTDLIITHHPIIFNPLKRIDTTTPLGILLAGNVSVISAHTNFDSAVMNDILCEKIGLNIIEPLVVEDGTPIGYVCELEQETAVKDLAKRVKSALGNRVVRYNDLGSTQKHADKRIMRVAVCSGSGGSLLGEVMAKGCDAYITGDVKHDVFIDAHNAGVCVFDAGHFHTENIFCEYMKNALAAEFDDVQFEIAKSNRDILEYEI